MGDHGQLVEKPRAQDIDQAQREAYHKASEFLNDATYRLSKTLSLPDVLITVLYEAAALAMDCEGERLSPSDTAAVNDALDWLACCLAGALVRPPSVRRGYH